jgi:maltose O-acetyltransferase
MVTLTIDNRTVTVPEGTTILEAARTARIEIPTMCYLKEINEIGACRLCIVEVEGQERLIPSAKGKNFEAFAPFYCEYGVNIYVGRNCFINYNSVFLDVAPITLGDNVLIGPNVTLATPNHPFIAEERAYTDYPNGCHALEYAEPITIGDHCWLCAGATVCGGVTIGAGSIIAAGAVVTRDIPPNSIAAGVPARVLRQIDERDRLHVWEKYVKNELPNAQR